VAVVSLHQETIMHVRQLRAPSLWGHMTLLLGQDEREHFTSHPHTSWLACDRRSSQYGIRAPSRPQLQLRRWRRRSWSPPTAATWRSICRQRWQT
jgi:hypothetical protein